MATAYTSLLGLALPVTGELSGTWGDTVNDYITKYLDASVAGTQTISGSQTAVTLSVTTNANLSQVGSGATGSAQYNIINCTGNPASMLTVTVPAASKTYVVVNATSTNQQVKIVGAGPTTGVTLAAGEKAVIAWNGSDFIKIATSAVDGVSTFSAGTTGFTPSTATSGAVTLGGTLATTNGGTGLTSFTANRVFYASSTSAIGQSANLTFDGTTLTANALTTTSTVTLNGGTANGIGYLNGSKVLTTGAALSFDGTNSGIGTNSPATILAASLSSSSTGLAIAGSVPTLALYDNSGTTGTGFIGQLNTDTYLFNKESGGLIFGVNNAEAMRLTSTGLGIGTSSPTVRLQLEQAANSAPVTLLRLNNSGTTAGGPGIASRISFTAGATALGFIQGSNFASGAAGLQFSGDGTNAQATLDASGNLGLGVTPSAWNTSFYTALQVGAGASLFGSKSNAAVAWIGANTFFNSSNSNTYIATAAATQYRQLNGEHAWFTAPSGTAGNPISFTQAMTLDASGNLLVGTTTGNGRLSVLAPADGSASCALLDSSNSGTAYAELKSAGTTYGYIGSGAALVSTGASTQLAIRSESSLLFSTGTTERARITSGGKWLVNTNSTAFPGIELVRQAVAADEAISVWNDTTTGDSGLIKFYTDAGVGRGSITYNRGGGVVAYNTTSDYRAKDIIGPVANPGATIDALKVYMGKMKGAAIERPMMIAHEAQAVTPYAVTGEKDAVNDKGEPIYQAMDHQVLVPLLIAELQSLRARVAALETK